MNRPIDVTPDYIRGYVERCERIDITLITTRTYDDYIFVGFCGDFLLTLTLILLELTYRMGITWGGNHVVRTHQSDSFSFY